MSATPTYPDWVVGAAESREVDPEFPSPARRCTTPGMPRIGLKDTSTVVDCNPQASLELEVRVRPFAAVNGVRFVVLRRATATAGRT